MLNLRTKPSWASPHRLSYKQPKITRGPNRTKSRAWGCRGSGSPSSESSVFSCCFLDKRSRVCGPSSNSILFGPLLRRDARLNRINRLGRLRNGTFRNSGLSGLLHDGFRVPGLSQHDGTPDFHRHWQVCGYWAMERGALSPRKLSSKKETGRSLKQKRTPR